MKLLFSTQTEYIDPDVYKVIVVIFIIVLIMWFTITILKRLLEHKLKNKILDKEISPDLASSVLKTGSNNETQNSIKWFIILAASGGGLFITNQYLPLGLHSIGIMTISIAFGFLLYIIYLKLFGK